MPLRAVAGFTLIEMLVTLSVMAVLVTIAAPSFRSVLLNEGIKAGAFDLFAALEYARSEAVKRNASATLRAGASTDGAWTTGWRVVDASNTSLRSWTAASNLAITEASSVTSVSFGRDGHLTSAAPKLQIAPATSVNGVFSRCIRVDLSGRAQTVVGNCP